tara:strand:+ start:399 stop:524 length:126 start_codon:yes stop_codon:yes gene_type:complete
MEQKRLVKLNALRILTAAQQANKKISKIKNFTKVSIHKQKF